MELVNKSGSKRKNCDDDQGEIDIQEKLCQLIDEKEKATKFISSDINNLKSMENKMQMDKYAKNYIGDKSFL